VPTYRHSSSLAIMSKSVKSNKWFVRIDGSLEEMTSKCITFSRCIDVVAMLAYYHTGSKKENPHIHVVVETQTIVQKQSFALRLKNHFTNIVKKTDYSCGVWDGNREMGAVSYMFHEEDVKLVVNKGFTDEQLRLASKANDAVQKVVAMNKEKASNKLVDSAVEHFKDQYPVKTDILAFMLRRCKSGDNYYPGEFMLKKFVEEVELKLVNEAQFDGMVWSMSKRLWRD